MTGGSPLSGHAVFVVFLSRARAGSICVNINIRLFSIVDAKMVDPAVALLTKAYGAVEHYAKRGLHPEEFLTFEFLKEHSILLQPGMLRLDWNRIPGLTRRIGTLTTVVVPDSLWGHWLGD